jgi:hypothetical protein
VYIVSYQALLYENKAHMVLQKYSGYEGDWQAEDKNKLSSENKMHDFYFNSLRLLKKESEAHDITTLSVCLCPHNNFVIN